MSLESSQCEPGMPLYILKVQCPIAMMVMAPVQVEWHLRHCLVLNLATIWDGTGVPPCSLFGLVFFFLLLGRAVFFVENQAGGKFEAMPPRKRQTAAPWVSTQARLSTPACACAGVERKDFPIILQTLASEISLLASSWGKRDIKDEKSQ